MDSRDMLRLMVLLPPHFPQNRHTPAPPSAPQCWPGEGGTLTFRKDNEPLNDGLNVAVNLPFCYRVIR